MRHIRSVIITSRFGKAAKRPIQQLVAKLGYELIPARVQHRDLVLGLLRRHGINVLLDVGANQGQYARSFRNYGFQGRILSFEPLLDAFKHLEREASFDSLWTARRMALGDRPGTAELQVTANSVSSSLLPIGPLHLRTEPLSRLVRTEAVQVSTLDLQLSGESATSRYWLKLDVQGYEEAVIDGGSFVLSQCRVVQCELSTRELYEGQAHYLEVLAKLDRAGLLPVSVVPGFADAQTGEMLQFDLIAVRSEELK